MKPGEPDPALGAAPAPDGENSDSC
jgi:hypothetical protein